MFCSKKNDLLDALSLIKVDVDGIEHLIPKGATITFKSKSLKSFYIEVNDDFTEQDDQQKEIFETASFSLKDKRH